MAVAGTLDPVNVAVASVERGSEVAIVVPTVAEDVSDGVVIGTIGGTTVSFELVDSLMLDTGGVELSK